MKRKYVLTGVLALVLAGAAIYFYAGSRTPSGQAPLLRLTTQNAATVKNAFNSAKDDVRVLLLLSPT